MEVERLFGVGFLLLGGGEERGALRLLGGEAVAQAVVFGGGVGLGGGLRVGGGFALVVVVVVVVEVGGVAVEVRVGARVGVVGRVVGEELYRLVQAADLRFLLAESCE